MGIIKKRLAELQIVLPPCPVPVANYVTGVCVDGLIYVAGQTAWQEDGTLLYPGKVGTEVAVGEAYQSARLSAIRLISELDALIDLDRIRILKVNGYVNADPSFKDHPLVMNGASDLLVSVFGQMGAHARTAIGVASLPDNASVEVELVAAVISEK